MIKHPLLKGDDVRKKGNWRNSLPPSCQGCGSYLWTAWWSKETCHWELYSKTSSKPLTTCLEIMGLSLPYKALNKWINGLTDVPVLFSGSALPWDSSQQPQRTQNLWVLHKHHKKNQNIYCGRWLSTQTFEGWYRLESFAKKKTKQQALLFHLSETRTFKH